MSCEMATVSFHILDQFNGSSGLADGWGTSLKKESVG
jgi:hypothetical protein